MRNSSRCFPRRNFSASFTLIEMLVAMVLLIILLGIVLLMTSQISQVWRNSTSRIQTFQEARGGFETVTRTLSQATLNSYYDYFYTNSTGIGIQRYSTNASTFVPNTYDRASDLDFVSGQAATLLSGNSPTVTTQTHAVYFQAPLGYSVAYTNLDNGLSTCGFFLKYDAATNSIPNHILTSPGYTPRYRYRLMESLQPTENLGVYTGGANDWMTNAVANSRVLTENVIAFIVLPKLPTSQDTGGTALAPTYNYDSRIPLGETGLDPNFSSATPAFPADSFTATGYTTATYTRHNQLPPLLHVVMIAIDEPSAIQLQAATGGSATPPAAINLAALSPVPFTDATKLTSDIQSVVDICNAKPGNLTGNTLHLNYRIFSTDVITREAKWSNN